MTFKHLKPGESHGVPYRVLLPIGIDNLWVPGRAVQGSLRVMPNCFAMEGLLYFPRGWNEIVWGLLPTHGDYGMMKSS